jgi:hypothetical protein
MLLEINIMRILECKKIDKWEKYLRNNEKIKKIHKKF